MKIPTLIRPGKFNGKRLYHRRYELGYNLQQIASFIGLTVKAVHFWETGERSPSPHSMKLLSQMLQVPPTYFFES